MRKDDASSIAFAGVVASRIAVLGLALACSLAAISAADELRVGIIKYKTEEKVRVSYTPLVGYLAEKLGDEPVVEILTDGSLAFRLVEGDYDVGVFTPFPYLEAKLSFPELDVFASHRVDGSETYGGAIVVRSDSGIGSLSDLRDGRFLFVKPTSTSGFKYPVGIFREHGFDVGIPEHLTLDSEVDGQFIDYGFSGGHDRSLEALLGGEADGVAIDVAALEALDAGDRALLDTIEAYDLPFHAWVFAPSVPPARRAEIERLMLAAHMSPNAAELFDNPLGITGWVERTDSEYNSLRRYLGMVRSPPKVAVHVEAMESARRALVEESDILAVVRDGIERELARTGRFEPVAEGGAHELRVDIGSGTGEFVCLLSLDGVRSDPFKLGATQLDDALPRMVAARMLERHPLEARLLNVGSRWFITYGTDDGLTPESYRFFVRPPDGGAIELGRAEIVEMTGLNTVFRPRGDFVRGAEIIARFDPAEGGEEAVVPSESTLEVARGAAVEVDGDEQGFFDNLDNRWGVVGLVVALASIAVGSWLSQRKKRRFTSIRNETLQLLSTYVESKYDLAAKIAEQREKIQRYLDQGHITENQYLILKDHIGEVERVIEKLGGNGEEPAAEALGAELEEAVADGVVTTDELESLARHAREGDEERGDREAPETPETPRPEEPEEPAP